MKDPAEALRWAKMYREMGLCPLPSERDEKRPIKSLGAYGRFRVEGIPEWVFTPEHWTTPNMQLMCGTQTDGLCKIAVIDCDGDQAREVWRTMCKRHSFAPDTWVALTPSGGRHFYFEIPGTVSECLSRPLWGLWDTYGKRGSGAWEKHKEIRLIGDGALAVAPPSTHVEIGTEYVWAERREPWARPLLEAPPWLLELPGVTTPSTRQTSTDRAAYSARRPKDAGACQVPSEFSLDGCSISDLRRAVVGSLAASDKIKLARNWGLRFTRDTPNHGGWCDCHAIDREDRNRSAGFNAETGVYRDASNGRTLSLFDLGVALGAFSDWSEALIWCADHFRIRTGGRA